MACDRRETRNDVHALPAWDGLAVEGREGWLADAALWLSGGTILALWTGLALLLTSA